MLSSVLSCANVNHVNGLTLNILVGLIFTPLLLVLVEDIHYLGCLIIVSKDKPIYVIVNNSAIGIHIINLEHAILEYS